MTVNTQPNVIIGVDLDQIEEEHETKVLRRHRNLSLAPRDHGKTRRLSGARACGYVMNIGRTLKPSHIQAVQMAWRQIYGSDGHIMLELLDQVFARLEREHDDIRRLFLETQTVGFFRACSQGSSTDSSNAERTSDGASTVPSMTRRQHSRVVLDMLSSVVDNLSTTSSEGSIQMQRRSVPPVNVLTVGLRHAQYYGNGLNEKIIDRFGELLSSHVATLEAVHAFTGRLLLVTFQRRLQVASTDGWCSSPVSPTKCAPDWSKAAVEPVTASPILFIATNAQHLHLRFLCD